MALTVQPGVEVVYTFGDAAGHKATSSVYMDSGETDPAAGGPAAVGTALQAISACALTSIACRIRATESVTPAPTDGPYARGADKLLLVMDSVDGSEANYQIGSPIETVMDADKIRVNKQNALITALRDALVTHACTAEGAALKGLKRGYRRRPPRRKGL